MCCQNRQGVGDKFLNKFTISVYIGSIFTVTSYAIDTDNIATLRDNTQLTIQKKTNSIPNVVNKDLKQPRNYAMQPPIIPHAIRNYEVNLRVNKCMSCHSRTRTEESQAPMVSVTHFMNSEGNFLAEISPRRYFCNQCHVTQLDTQPLVENTYVDSATLMKAKANQ